MTLDAEQVLALAPDTASAAAGRKLAALDTWQVLGRNDVAIWGECRGSALYQTRADLRDLSSRCSCPSRKLPCKHVLGLLLLAAGSPDVVPLGEPPAWVSEWLAKRAGAARAREARLAPSASDADAPQAAKRAGRRLSLVREGIDALDLWLADLVRHGLAGLELQPASFWEKQAARLVDAQAPGLAARIRRLAGIPGASPDWPERLLAALGRLALLNEAFRRLDSLDPALQADVRGLIGWTLKEEEVLAHGDHVRDTWLVIGQWIEEEDRGRAQRTWLLGRRSGRGALILQFSFAGAPFPPSAVPGTALDATLAFWPSANPQRALIQQRHSAPIPITAALYGPSSTQRAPALAGRTSPPYSAVPTAGAGTDAPASVSACRDADPAEDAWYCATPIVAFLARVAGALARQPWLDRFPCLLSGVVPVASDGGSWLVCDASAALPLVSGDHWSLLAHSGGRPIDLAAEWDGQFLRPLGLVSDGSYHRLWEAR